MELLVEFLIQVVLFGYRDSMINKKYTFWDMFWRVFLVSFSVLLIGLLLKFIMTEQNMKFDIFFPFVILFKVLMNIFDFSNMANIILLGVCLFFSLLLPFHVKYLEKKRFKEQMELEKVETKN
jgi:hypothetical protein